MIWIRIGMLALSVAFGAAAGSTYAQQAAGDVQVDRARLKQRLVAVERLLENSSGARQVEASGDAAAREKRGKALAIYREARAAFDAGEYARAATLLSEASAQMFEAVRVAAPEQVTGPKARTDYEARLASVNALHAAYRRVAAEKLGATDAAETSRGIENLVREAERQAGEGKVEAGRATLDRAYLLTKAAVSSLRGGDTLVRSLNFASREEEYRYEVDRNDTHQMLVKVLLEGKPRTSGQQAFIDKALQLRTRAEAAAAGSDHEAGVKLLEESTRELIRAIRNAGVFIPG